MKPNHPFLLTLNGGSSSIRFALYRMDGTLARGLSGKLDRIGMPGMGLTFQDPVGEVEESLPLTLEAGVAPEEWLLGWLEARPEFASIKAVGHRVVHGMERTGPEWVAETLIEGLNGIVECDPEHLPRAIALMDTVRRRHPELRQVACFDTAFHRTLPRVARLLPIPRRYDAKGIQRYGFHGLSYAYLMEELTARGDAAAAKGRVILAHLGNGASMAAVRDGCSVETSMGFTPTAGLVMGRRSGDLDPGVAAFLWRTEGLSLAAYSRMVSSESGLLGISETSSDMRDLLSRAPGDVRAAEAVDLFCHQAKKCVGSYAAVLGGLDTLVFAGGIGENCPTVRALICEGLGFLGIELQPERNAENAPVISRAGGRVVVRVIRTDEELMIARAVSRLMDGVV